MSTPTMYHMSRATCFISGVRCILFFIFFFKEVFELVGGGPVINRAYPVKFIMYQTYSYIIVNVSDEVMHCL